MALTNGGNAKENEIMSDYKRVIDWEFRRESAADWLEFLTGCRCIGIVIKGDV